MTQTPEQIAAGLTKTAQDELLSSVITPSGDVYLRPDPDEEAARQLYLEGCITLRDCLTPLGQQVRTILERNRNDAG